MLQLVSIFQYYRSAVYASTSAEPWRMSSYTVTINHFDGPGIANVIEAQNTTVLKIKFCALHCQYFDTEKAKIDSNVLIFF